SLIMAPHSVSSLSDPAREAAPCSRDLRPARDVDTTCTVRRNVYESLATKVRAHRAPNLLRGCVDRLHVDHTDAREATVRRFGRSDRSEQRLISRGEGRIQGDGSQTNRGRRRPSAKEAPAPARWPAWLAWTRKERTVNGDSGMFISD